MRQHSSALERKWNRQLTRPIFPAGAKNAVWKRNYGYTSVAIAFITLITILGYHIFQQSRHTKLGTKILKLKSTDKKVSFKQDANDNTTNVQVVP